MFVFFWSLVGAGAGASLIYGLFALGLLLYNPDLYHTTVSTIWFIAIGSYLLIEAFIHLSEHHEKKVQREKEKNKYHKII